MLGSSKRKTYLINPQFQLSFIIFSVITPFLGISVFYAAINYFFWTFKNLGAELGIPSNHVFFRFISDQSHRMDYIFFVSAIIVIFISMIGALILSHRVAGPIYRMTKHLKNISDTNELKEVKFRKNDFFIELQEAFNNFVNKKNS